MDPIKVSGVGLFLKTEREKKGLSLDHVARATRLRIHFLEALENEDWAKLPSTVFIKGFIKTYAKALGLDYREVIGQFQSSIPIHDGLPKPLVDPKKHNNKGLLALLSIFLVAVLVIILFLVRDSFKGANVKQPDSQVETVSQAPATLEPGSVNPSEHAAAKNTLLAETGPEAAVKPKTLAQVETAPPPVFETTGQKNVTEKTTVDVKTQVPLKASSQPPVEEPQQQAVTAVTTENGDSYALTGRVTERTYIKMYVDNAPPKEYIFLPGSTPQWTAKEGFYIVVGNAAGIEFDFNNRRIKNLGESGKVIRLRLPDNFNLTVDEN